MSKRISKVSFVGRPGGDMECFCWKDVPIEDIVKIKGKEAYEEEVELEESVEKDSCRRFNRIYDPQKVADAIRMLYPNDVIGEAGDRKIDGKKFKFTIIVEEIEDEPE